MSASDTIFALASARGRAGVAVIRLSGRDAFEIAERISGPLGKARSVHLKNVCIPSSGELIDRGLVISFDEGNSFTGEQVVEFQTHGSISVVDTLLQALGSFDGCRLAEPGEFTRRALMNGKMNLVEVEGLADLIEAETDEQRRQANRVMSGELSHKADKWKLKLLKINSLLEVSIDFSDEELPEELLSSLSTDISELQSQLQNEVDGSKAGEIVRNGFVVAIVGKPNVGKSTLLNALTGRDVAIASEIAGTTRDTIEVRLNLKGIPVILLDTAGLRETSDQIESLGINRTLEKAADADLRVFLVDHPNDVSELGVGVLDGDVLVMGKSDLRSAHAGLQVSGLTGAGLDLLIEQIETVLSARVSKSSAAVRQRHVDSLNSAIASLYAARELIEAEGYDIEIVSERIRETISHLDHLVGRFNVEAVLGEIFSSFCIGK